MGGVELFSKTHKFTTFWRPQTMIFARERSRNSASGRTGCWVLKMPNARRLPCQSDKIPGQRCFDVNPIKLTLKYRGQPNILSFA